MANGNECKVSGCANVPRSRGLCPKHYTQERRKKTFKPRRPPPPPKQAIPPPPQPPPVATNRGSAVVPWPIVEAVCQYNATITQVCETLILQGYPMDEATLRSDIRKLYQVTFEEYRDRKTSLTKLKLVQKATKMALEGNPQMLIFVLKGMCGWRDHGEPQAQLNVNVNVQDQIAQIPREKIVALLTDHKDAM